jgi:Na+/melibiose symporter-like transporter
MVMVALLSVYKLNSRVADDIARELAKKRETAAPAGQPDPALNSAIQE